MVATYTAYCCGEYFYLCSCIMSFDIYRDLYHSNPDDVSWRKILCRYSLQWPCHSDDTSTSRHFPRGVDAPGPLSTAVHRRTTCRSKREIVCI